MLTDHEHDHVLPDGTTVHLRAIRPDDRSRLLRMWERTSPESRYARFHGTFRLDESNVGRFTDLDPELQYALVATLGRGDEERIVGVARYERDPDRPERADFATLVEDAHQGRGIGTALVRHVAQAAHEAGVEVLHGDVLADNTRMLRLIRDVGLQHSAQREPAGAGSVVSADLGLDLTDEFLRVVAEDERRAAAAALERFFRPEAVAVVGASRDRRSIGGMVFDHLLQGGFAGVVYPVNVNADYVQGVAAYDSLADCPRAPDLVIVCVPAPHVNEIVDEAGKLGIRAVCVISAGFAEAGEEGRERQRDLMERARSHGLRVVGPNCMGLLNGAADVRMNGTFSDIFPKPGRLAFSSQSGALGLAVLEHAHRLGLGISTFISVGNKADISGNDLLLYWEEDSHTDVILLYLESFGNPRKFSRIARRLSRSKPIVAVKSGRTKAGVRAASSHTAAMSSGDVAVDALFRQAGVIRTDTLSELFDVATLLSSQPLPAGRRVAIVTNAGGPGILAADACESNDLLVPALAERTRSELAEFLPDEAGMTNPVDMIASASADNFRRALTILGSADEIDAVFVIFIPAGTTETADVAAALATAEQDLPDEVPVLSVFMSAQHVPDYRQAHHPRRGNARGLPPTAIHVSGQGGPDELADARIPSFAFPEDAARALGRVARYAAWRARPLGSVVVPDGVDADRARGVVESALRADRREDGRRLIGSSHAGRAAPRPPVDRTGGVWLSAQEADAVLRSYGINLAAARIASDPDDAATVAGEIGFPVTAKVAAPIHKSDVGGIALGLDSPEAVADAVRELSTNVREHGLEQHADSFLIQEMVDGVAEMVVGVSHDPSFGPIVMTGLGGTLVELLEDVSARITPLTDVDIDEMLRSLKMWPLLTGYRGQPPADVDALRDLLARIGAMVEDLPEITELDLNPVFVREKGQGVVAVDVRLKVAPAP